MGADELSDPFRGGPVGAVCAFADEVKVAGDVAACLDVDVEAGEVGFYKGDEAGECGGGWSWGFWCDCGR